MTDILAHIKSSPVLREARRFKLVSAAFLVSFVLVAGGLTWGYSALRGNDQRLILRFAEGRGIMETGSVWDLAGIGSFAILIIVVNFVLALSLESRDWFLGKFVAACTVIMSILIFIGFAAIIGVN